MSNKRKRNRPLGRKGRGPSFSKELLGRAAFMAASGKLIPLKDDISFKMFLADSSPESNACLRYLLSALTGRDVAKAKVTNAEVLPEYAKGKMPRMDINCTFNDGQKADIELQLGKDKDDQKLRSLFYACKLYAGCLKQGDTYKSAPSVYQIFLVDFDLFEDGRFYHRAMMRLDDGKVLADKLQVLFFSLKVPGRVRPGLKKAANWCKFIAGCTNPEVLQELGKDADWKEEYMRALEACIKISAEERAWAYHLSMDRAEADYRNEIELNREEARDEERRNGLRNLMDSMSWTADQAMDALKIPEAERDKYAAMLSS